MKMKSQWYKNVWNNSSIPQNLHGLETHCEISISRAAP